MTSVLARKRFSVAALCAAACLGVSMGGCGERKSDVGPTTAPLAVVGDGVEVIGVVRDARERRLEATIVAQNQERTVTIAPLAERPLPSGFSASLRSADGTGVHEIAYAWDESDGRSWVSQQTSEGTLTLMRRVESGRVYETYTIDGDNLDVEYANLPVPQIDKAVQVWRNGGLSDVATPELRELGVQLSRLDAFLSAHGRAVLEGDSDQKLLVTLVNDPTFVGTVTGRTIEPERNAAQQTCRALAMCSALSCRLVPDSPVCWYCFAGYAACVIVDFICQFIGCDCCF